MPCPHGRRRSRCKECGGSSLCEHGRQRSQCKECGGSSICEHGRRRSTCKECGRSGHVTILDAIEVEFEFEDGDGGQRRDSSPRRKRRRLLNSEVASASVERPTMSIERKIEHYSTNLLL